MSQNSSTGEPVLSEGLQAEQAAETREWIDSLDYVLEQSDPERVIQQGDYGEELFIVEKGELEVLIDVHDGMQHVATLKRGDFFGEMSLLTGEQRRATVRSDGEVSLFVVSKDSLQPVLEASPALAENMSAVLAERELALRNSNRPSTAGDPAVTERSGELLQRIREFFSI